MGGAPAGYNPPMGNQAYLDDLSKNIFQLLGDKSSIYVTQAGTGRECLEMATGCEISNRFQIKDNKDSQPLFTLKEDSNCCVRQCCKNITPFTMSLLDAQGNPHATYDRPFHCTNTTCCCPCGWMCNPCAWECCCGTQAIEMKTHDGQTLGHITEDDGSWCGLSSYTIYDRDNKPLFVAMVPCCELCRMCCCQDVDLHVYRAGQTADEDAVPTITRECICDCVNVMTDKDHFDIKFAEDQNLSPLDKFFIMSTFIMIKYMHFEQNDDGGGGGGGG